jgi:cephalosporin hydroxylase
VETSDQLIAGFHTEFMRRRCPWTTRYRGVELIKNPLDLWIYHELIWSTAPRTIIETGTHRGGSALWLADQLDLLGAGQVWSIDIGDPAGDRPPQSPPPHPRLTYVLGDSASVALPAEPEPPVMVILDSDHSAQHVYAELTRFAPLVTVGSWMIVEDSNVPEFAPDLPGDAGAAAARFLAERDDWAVDRSCERYLVTCNPGGFLRRLR